MKKINLSKKLNLNKEIIIELSSLEKKNIKGGKSSYKLCSPSIATCNTIICEFTVAKGCRSLAC